MRVFVLCLSILLPIFAVANVLPIIAEIGAKRTEHPDAFKNALGEELDNHIENWLTDMAQGEGPGTCSTSLLHKHLEFFSADLMLV